MQRFFSSTEVGALIGADSSSINRWIDAGQLRGFRTPGGHRRVQARDLLAFLRERDIPVPDELRDGRRSLLLLDASEPALRALRKALLRAREDLEIETCTSGLDALILLGARRPDVLLLDVQLPGVDPAELCRRVKATAETEETLVIACATRVTPQLEAKLLEAGAAAVLAKPIKAAAVISLIAS